MVRYIVKRAHAPVYSQPSIDSSIVTRYPQGLYVDGRVHDGWLVIDRGYIRLADVERLRG